MKPEVIRSQEMLHKHTSDARASHGDSRLSCERKRARLHYSEFRVRPVAKRLARGVLTATEVGRAAFGRLVLDRRERTALVTAVAEGLVGALSAGAPPVALS